MNYSVNEKLYLLYTIQHPLEYTDKIEEKFFRNDDLKKIFQLVSKFYARFKTSPSKTNLVKLAQQHIEKLNWNFNVNVIESIFDEDLDAYEHDWLVESLENWIKWNIFENSLKDTIEFVKTSQVNENNLDVIIAKSLSILNQRNNALSFNGDLGSDLFDLQSHVVKETDKIKSNKQFINSTLGGGYDKKTLIVYIGEQGKGKSIFLCNDAADFIRMGKNVVYISAEMSEYKVLKRIGSNLFDVPMEQYDRMMRNPDFAKKKFEQLEKENAACGIGKLIVKQMADPSTLDIENYMHRLKEKTGVKYDVLIVDYINIMSNWKNKNGDNTYVTLKDISKGLRDISIVNDWLCITGCQIGKQGWDASDLTLSDIAESAAITHNADVIYGIIQDQDHFREKEFWLKVLKIRDGAGKNTKIRQMIDYEYMRITDTLETMDPML